MEHLWGKVGFIVQLSQMIEYSLSNVLAFYELLHKFDNREVVSSFEFNEFAKRANDLYKELSKKSLGFGIKKARQLGCFRDKSQKWLKEVCDERNFVIHKLFKEDLLSKHLETDPEFYYERLEKLITKMYDINLELNDIFIRQKAEYRLFW